MRTHYLARTAAVDDYLQAREGRPAEVRQSFAALPAPLTVASPSLLSDFQNLSYLPYL